MLLSLMAKLFASSRTLFTSPEGDAPPPWWIRSILVLTCGLVSFSHGSNDGQKGIGLMMLILIGIIPATFALNQNVPAQDLEKAVAIIQQDFAAAKETAPSPGFRSKLEKADAAIEQLALLSATIASESKYGLNSFEVRKNILLLRNELKNLKNEPDFTKSAEAKSLYEHTEKLKQFTDYAPFWVVVLIALSLGIGTMVGWKRIVVTIGEKIGKTHLTYAQGATAEIVAASTIAASTYLGLPVSTTHVLSSGIAGSMFASGGVNNLDRGTVTKILLAWVLTLPVCLTMSATLFLLFRYVFG
jgi:PiT family inorganic phosphate transporter